MFTHYPFGSITPDAKPTFSIGDTIEIKVNDKILKTYIDPLGTQRFVPNAAVKLLLDSTLEVFNQTHMKGIPLPVGHKSMNELGVDFQLGKISLGDYMEFHAMIGYSVCGFLDVTPFSSLPVDNPVWY